MDIPEHARDPPDITEAGLDVTEHHQGKPARKSYIDPLVYLREYASQNKKILYEDDWLDFDGHKIHRTAKCGFMLSTGASLIDIGSVWYMLHETSADRSYTQTSTRAKGFAYIGVAVRGELCDFLLGRTSTCPGLVKEVIEGRKRPREKAPVHVAKRPKVSADGTCLAGKTPLCKADITFEEARQRVRSVQDLDVIIRRPGRMVPHAALILKIAQEEWQNWTLGPKAAQPAEKSKSTSISFRMELEKALEQDPRNLPIILVPCNKNAPVNMLNVRKFLQEGVYERPSEEHIRFFEATREEFTQVSRNLGGKIWTFEIRDSIQGFTKKQWTRTMLVISDGNEWQFKDWPFETVVDLFSTIRGVYFVESGKPLARHVAQWPCMKITLPVLHAQHRFAHIRDQIFSELEDFMNGNRVKKFVNSSGMGGLRTQVEHVKCIL